MLRGKCHCQKTPRCHFLEGVLGIYRNILACAHPAHFCGYAPRAWYQSINTPHTSPIRILESLAKTRSPEWERGGVSEESAAIEIGLWLLQAQNQHIKSKIEAQFVGDQSLALTEHLTNPNLYFIWSINRSVAMDMRFPYSPAEVAKVRMVQFGILSPDEIVTSRCPITFHSFSVWFSGNYRKNKRKKNGIRWQFIRLQP